jgi:hypothetical protein
MQAQVFALPMPAADAAEPPLSESQHTLRRAIASKAHEERLVADIGKRLHRLQQIVDEDRVLESRIHELLLAHQAERALWLEQGADRPEPRPSQTLLEIKLAHAQLQPDVAASMGRIPAVAAEQADAIERLQTAARVVDLACYTAAVEACRPAATLAATAFRTGLEWLARVISVVEELRRAPADDNAAYAAAVEIDRLIAEARAAGVPPAPASIGRQLLDALHANPAAELPL